MTTKTDTNGYVLIDSCIYCADIHGSGASTTIFTEGVERLNFTLLVPEIIRDEVLNKYHQLLSSCITKYQNSTHNIQMFTGHWPKLDFPEINDQSIEERFTKSFPYSIEKSQVSLLPYPQTNHQTLAIRAISKKKPFNEKGTGYRDCLICETIKEFFISNEDAKLTFVTMNHRDFLDNGKLHPEILEDFQSCGIDPSRIETFQNIGEFNKKYFLPRLTELDSLLEDFRTGKETRFNVNNWVQNDLSTLLNDDEWAEVIAGIPHLSSYVSKCEPSLKVSYDDVRQLPSEDVLLSLSITLHVELQISFDGQDYDRDYEGMCELVGEPEGYLGYCTTWIPVETTIALSLVLDKDTFTVKSAQVDELESRDGYCEAQPHPVK